ncbi:DNA mismatch repair endonuclease MutL [Candidatus Acetothermia bacterium]|nr:DNA mismatch repair endonuclease MutL [Candidatus Acetothermia bacterium]
MEYRKVKELDAHLINKIAAGEVIERPASIAKELIENALDAGSSAIEILVEAGGVARLSVADDGSGIARDDILIAVKRHTTSKISSEDDLFQIRTLGFRGEALASIVEVAKTTITTWTEQDSEGTQVIIEGGNVSSVKAAARARGTTVDVRDLFFNTPARRKFLKSDKTEFFHILRVVKRFVLSHSNVHFRLFHNGKSVLNSPPSLELRQTVASLYGAELARSLLEVSSEREGLRVSGLVSPPSSSRSDRSDQFIFVNRRFVKDSAINYAIGKSYENLLKANQHPIVFLFIEIDPSIVDVNVHPKKEEVRFADPVSVQAEVKRAITNALASPQAVPRFETKISSSLQTGPQLQPPAHSVASPTKLGPSSWQSRPSMPAPPPGAVAKIRQLDLRQEIIDAQKSYAQLQAPGAPSENVRIVGQVHGTYIIVETQQGFEIIDQHVAHERILYEKFLEQMSAGRIARQRLLIPITIELPPDQAQLLAQHVQMLDEKLGIGLEYFGGSSFVLRDWPQVLSDSLTKDEFKSTIGHILQALEQEDSISLEELAKHVAASFACESAVVKNSPLRPEEMISLVRQLKQVKNPNTCPHGRPIVISYSVEDLEKKFGRR